MDRETELLLALEKVQLELNDTSAELTRVFGVYERLCCSPFYWFIRPLDKKIDGRELMKCDCGGVFWLDRDAEFTIHQGHKYRRAIETSVWTYLKARYLSSWIK
jgi:hypothetical protein